MKKTPFSASLPLFALVLCSCATAKPKSTQSNVRFRSVDQSFAPVNQTAQQREYMFGKFVVTAVNGSTVVLRQMSPDQDRSTARIIVEYPAGLLIPQQGTVIERQKGAGFEVREVTQSPDGQTNVYVRDLVAQ